MGAIERMTITMPAEMADTLRKSVDAGEYASTSEVIREAVRDWASARDVERRQLNELRSMIQEGIDSGPGIPAEDAYAELKAMIEEIRARRA